MNKKVFSLLLALALLLGLSSAALAQEPITLTFWTPTWRQAAEEPIIADFMAQNPDIKIETTFYSSDDIKTNTKIAASSGTLPDMWYNWGGALSDFYAENELILDLTQYARDNNWSEKYLPGALEQCTYAGQLIGLPQNLAGLVMYYRADLFEKFDITVPTTMEELEAAADILLKNGITPFSSYNRHMMRYHEALLEYYGGMNEHDELLLLEADWGKSEAVAKSFAKLKEWYDKGYFPADILASDTSTANMYVYSGSAAMIMENPGMASQIVANNYDPALYGWFAFPSSPEGKGRVSAYAKLVQFNKHISEEKLAAAMRFWDYYYSDESLKAHPAIEQPTARIGAELPENYALAQGILEVISDNGSYATMDLKVPAEVMAKYFSVLDQVLLGSVAPENAGAEIQVDVENYKFNN